MDAVSKRGIPGDLVFDTIIDLSDLPKKNDIKMIWQQQQQAQAFLANHAAAVQSYNDFATKAFAEPDFKAIQNFAVNELFTQLNPYEQQLVANSYLRVERQIASSAEMKVVTNYFERAKAAYRSRGRGGSRRSNQTQRRTTTLPRTDQIKGSASFNDGQLSERDIEQVDMTKDGKLEVNHLDGNKQNNRSDAATTDRVNAGLTDSRFNTARNVAAANTALTGQQLINRSDAATTDRANAGLTDSRFNTAPHEKFQPPLMQTPPHVL